MIDVSHVGRALRAGRNFFHFVGAVVRDVPRPARRGDAIRDDARFERVDLLVPYEEGGKLAELYALGAPIEERVDGPDGVLVRARLPRRELRRFAQYLVAEAESTASAQR